MSVSDILLRMEFPTKVGMRQRFILIDVAISEPPYQKSTADVAIKIGATRDYTRAAVRKLVSRGLLNRALEKKDGKEVRTLSLSDELKKRIEEIK